MHADGRGFRFVITLLSLSGALATAGGAQASTVFVEAEGGVTSDAHFNEQTTSPMLIKDDANASKGRYITVEAGFDSKTSPPTAEGIAKHSFSVANSGTYRIWGRVIAPNDGDDSFWVRVDGGTPIKWNEIELGSSWHWDIVRHDGSPSPSQLSLSAGDHTIEISYREDGTKLDVLVITDDTSFNPDSPPTTAPTSDLPGISFPFVSSVGSRTAITVMWSAVPGAATYTVRRLTESGPVVWQTGLTAFKIGDTSLPPLGENKCYDVIAVFPDASSRPAGSSSCSTADLLLTFIDVASMTFTLPMLFDEPTVSATTVAGTTESLHTVPAHGRVRYDFMTGGATQVRLWFRVIGPNPDADSFWVRMDDGAWFKWNNFTGSNGTCMPVGDFTNVPVTFTVPAGSHRFELAYREIGARVEANFFVTEDLQATSSLCND
jgi:hypothetical protein